MILKYLLLPVLLVCSVVLFSQTNNLSSLESAIVDQILEEELLLQEIMGMSVGIVKDGKIIYTKGYGHTDFDRKIPLTTSTVFNWASISKTLTAVAAFQLIEEDRLSKSSKAKEILKGIWTNSDDENEITLGHLLSHRSGIRHYNQEMGGDQPANYDAYTDNDLRTDWNSKQSVAIFNDIELKSTPADSFRYSTFGYNLAGAMIDKISPVGYVGHITKRILAPLDTKSINIARKPWTAFSKNCNGAVRIWEENEKRPYLPGGGWRSNIQDLTVFMNALINNTLLNNTAALWDDVIVNGMPVVNKRYRFGLRVEADTTNNELIVMHAGKHENVRTLLVFFPKSKLGFTIMINGGYGNAHRVFRKLATTFGKPQNFYQGPLMNREFISGCDNDITGVWSMGNESSLVRYGYESNRFNKEKEHLESKKYHLIDCEYFLRGNKLLMSGIFKKGGNPSKFIPPLDYEAFSKVVLKLKANRYIINDIEVFQNGDKVLWSGIALKQLNKTFILRDYDTEAFKMEIERQKNDGKSLIDIESYQKNGVIKWAGLFRTGATFDISILDKKADFAAARATMRNSNLSLRDLEIVNIDGELFYSGIFQPANTNVGYKSNRSHSQIAILNNSRVANSLRLIDIERPFAKN